MSVATISFELVASNVNEVDGGSNVLHDVKVVRSGHTEGAAYVDYSISAGTASATDFSEVSSAI